MTTLTPSLLSLTYATLYEKLVFIIQVFYISEFSAAVIKYRNQTQLKKEIILALVPKGEMLIMIEKVWYQKAGIAADWSIIFCSDMKQNRQGVQWGNRSWKSLHSDITSFNKAPPSKGSILTQSSQLWAKYTDAWAYRGYLSLNPSNFQYFTVANRIWNSLGNFKTAHKMPYRFSI